MKKRSRAPSTAPESGRLLSIEFLREKVADPQRYPYSLPLIRQLSVLEMHPAVTFFVGENGSGKSTLLEAIAIALGFNPEGGTRNFRFSTRSSHSDLHSHLRIARTPGRPRDGFFLRAESFFNVASEIERLDAEPSGGSRVIDAYGGRSLHEQSHGEAFLSLMLNRFSGSGLYLLDEPEAALSPSRQLAMIARLHDLVQGHSQFVIATHSPILMAYPDAWIYEITDSEVRRVRYEDTEHYVVARRFLSDPAKHLEMLMT